MCVGSVGWGSVCVCVWGEVSVVCGLCVIEPSKIANDIYSREIN